jgi:phage-related protein
MGVSPQGQGQDRSGTVRETVSGRRIVIVRVFVKKTQKTPRREIRLALERAEEVE